MFFKERRAKLAFWMWCNLSPGRTIADAYDSAFVNRRTAWRRCVARFHLRWMGRLLRLCRIVDPYFR